MATASAVISAGVVGYVSTMRGTTTTTRRRAILGATLAAAAAISSTAIAGASAPPSDDAEAATETAVPIPDEVDPDASVVIGWVLEPTNLDILHTEGAAIEQVLLDNVYETLLTYSDDGVVEPGLGSLEVSEDRLTYTITLQEGITFHDGSALDADDVVFSMNELRGEDGQEADNLASVESVTAIDDLTVEIALSRPDNNLAWNLTRRSGSVLSSEAVDLENSAVGTGPFILEEWIQGDSIVLTRFVDYHGEPAGAAEVVYAYITDPNAAVAALKDGDLDILARVNTELVSEFEDSPDWVISTGPTNGEYTLGMNNAHEALSDIRVRQAITMAIDKQGILELYNGYGTIVGAPVPPTDPWFEDLTGLYPYDPDQARALLEEAGYGDGLELDFIVPNVYQTADSDFIVSQLGDVGIEVNLQSVEFPTWGDQVYGNKEYDLTLVLHVEPRDVPNYANPDYYWNYDSPRVQELVADAQTAESQDEYVDLMGQAARQIAEDAPTVVLLIWNDIVVAHPNVAGYPTVDVGTRFDASDIVVAA